MLCLVPLKVWFPSPTTSIYKKTENLDCPNPRWNNVDKLSFNLESRLSKMNSIPKCRFRSHLDTALSAWIYSFKNYALFSTNILLNPIPNPLQTFPVVGPVFPRRFEQQKLAAKFFSSQMLYRRFATQVEPALKTFKIYRWVRNMIK